MSMLDEEEVKWRRFDKLIKKIRQAFADMPTEQLEDLIDEAVAAVRKQRGESEYL